MPGFDNSDTFIKIWINYRSTRMVGGKPNRTGVHSDAHRGPMSHRQQFLDINRLQPDNSGAHDFSALAEQDRHEMDQALGPYIIVVTIIVILLRQIDPVEVVRLLVNIDWRWLLAAAGAYAFTNLVRAFRFNTLLKLHAGRVDERAAWAGGFGRPRCRALRPRRRRAGCRAATPARNVRPQLPQQHASLPQRRAVLSLFHVAPAQDRHR